MPACGPRATPARPDDPPASSPSGDEDHAGHDHHDHHRPPPAPPDDPADPDDPPAVDARAALRAAELAAYEAARPVFEAHCASCHTQGARGAKQRTLAHFDMTTYPLQGHHAHEMGVTIRKVLGLTGRKPTMPKGKPGAVQGDELALIEAWAAAWDAADAAGAHEVP